MPYCPQCGSKIEVNWNNCPNCGYNLTQEYELIKANNQRTAQFNYEQISSDQQRVEYPPYRTYSAGQSNTYGIIALIFGLLGFCCILGSYNFIFGVVAIICGAIGMKKDEKPQMAKIGLALGIIVLVCGIFIFVMMIPFLTYFLLPY
jgi:hypothetical protein